MGAEQIQLKPLRDPAPAHRPGMVGAAMVGAAPPVAFGPSPARRAAAAAKPLRVLMVVESSAAGTGRHVLDLSEGLIRRGCEVHLAYATGRADRLFLDRLPKVQGLRHAAVPMRTNIHPSDVWAVRAVRRYARASGGFDVIHGHSSKGGAVARLAALGTRAAAFYTLHGLVMMDPGLPRWKRVLYQGIEVGLSLRTRRIIAVSPEEERAAVRVGLGRSRVAWVPNGVGAPELAPRAAARRAIGAGDEEFVFGFVGRLVNQKAPHVLLGAFAATAQAAPHARLAVVGAGPLETALRDSAKRLGVADRVTWLGERDAREVFAGFDAFAISSRKEGLPYVVLEAMAAGLPVVATETSGVESLIRPGVNGEVVPCDDIGAFSAAMTHLARHPALVARYGRAARQRAKQFTIDEMVDRTLRAYRGEPEPLAPDADLVPRPAAGTPPGRGDGSAADRPWRPEQDGPRPAGLDAALDTADRRRTP